MASGVDVRRYQSGEEAELWNIYYGAIHRVCSRDYTPEQVSAWAPADFDAKTWAVSVAQLNPYVAVLNSRLVGYTEIQSDGLIDHFFVHPDYQGCGVGAALMNRIFSVATGLGISRLYSHVSKTAQPFYQRFGFQVIAQNTPVIRGVALSNATMEKHLV